ncbi:Rieske (2Fe-2S) protein [Mucilaginibacter sp.]|uniref:Rieske (2Fe-2S) protein n=1 Tax=Mucilaginibacter sp. TaxID=1882438 RepID=UPI0026166187|nr:Rieske (2Fe-2S) protein [Mucilaginibacter sp.]MDB4925006.1 (2Fe-2S)-binding protein [Mucilaginibacter sp.]
MDRKDFLSAIGLSAASFAVISCIGCSKNGNAGSSGVSGPTNIDFTLDLNASSNAALLTNGGYLTSNGIIVARTTAGTYIAVQQSCTHESYPLTYQAANKRFTAITMVQRLPRPV